MERFFSFCAIVVLEAIPVYKGQGFTMLRPRKS